METIWMEYPIESARNPRSLPPVTAIGPAARRRRFWCAEAGREVEVQFEERGFPGLRRSTAVKSCPVFHPPTAVACRRRCLDAPFPRRWEFALPVRTKAGG